MQFKENVYLAGDFDFNLIFITFKVSKAKYVWKVSRSPTMNMKNIALITFVCNIYYAMLHYVCVCSIIRNF